MFLVSQLAANMALTPKITELLMYTRHLPNSALFIKLTLSNPKVENVVNAPKKPVAINNFSSLGKLAFKVKISVITPIKKQPIMLVHNVAVGKLKLLLAKPRLKLYLAIAPNAPPKDIYNKFIIFFCPIVVNLFIFYEL